MFLLDTNVISELMKPSADSRVLHWLDEKSEMDLFISAITKAEIETGVAILAEGKRKLVLHEAAREIFSAFEERCLPLDCESAVAFAETISLSRNVGRPMSIEDAQIAAIARQQQMTLVTRNEPDFDFLPQLTLVNPWRP